MTKNKQLILIALLVLLFFGCRKDNLNGIYERPSWLAGKLYTQILTKPELSTFAELLKISGYDTIIDVSGSFTVFAPSNAAFTTYFQENPTYKSVADMPKSEVLKLVKYHLVQDAWSKKQLTTLDVNGWIDTLDLKNNLPKGYKRETLYQGKNQNVGVAWSKYNRRFSIGYGALKRNDIIDTTLTSWHRRIFNDSRKYAPIFYKDYFSIYNLAASDFEFYFGKPFLNGDLYYCGGKIISDELFAENGFVYVIDQVAKPLKNGAEILSDKSKGPDNSYTLFYDLVNKFSELSYNETETNKQPGATIGLKVDSLFNVSYPQLIFNIYSETTKAPEGTYGLPSNVTIRYHHGIVAPTNKAFNQLVNEYIAVGNGWKNLTNAPENIKRIIANSSLSINSIYETDILNQGFLNGEADYINVDPSTIAQKEYGSNCTFIGVNKPIVPRAFSSITGPVYLRPGFSKVMFAIENSGLLSALKRKGANYSFYVASDATTTRDSSFFYDPVFRRFTAATMYPSIKTYPISVPDLQILLLNQVALDQPKKLARKEFIRNLAGNYLIYDKETGVVSGSAPSTFGYKGTIQIQNKPVKISTNSDNGSTYEVDSWFNFSVGNIYSYLAVHYPKFHVLINKAKLRDDKLGKYTFMSDNQYYTVFAPTDSVLNTVDTNSMSLAELQNFVMTHFVQGDIIFTDGNKPSGFYETCRIDETSAPNSIVNSKIKIETGIDQITIPSKDGLSDVVVNESRTSNILMGKSIGTGTEAYTNCVSNGVVHEIKKALLFGNLETK